MRPSPDLALSPRDMARAGLCVGCGACAARHADGRMDMDRYGQLKPVGAWRGGREESLGRLCPFSPQAADETEIAAQLFPVAPHRDAQVGRFEAAYVGAAEADFRRDGSSGGAVSWVAVELMRRGLVDGVAHVAPEEGSDRFFRYRISRSEADVRAGAKSRYYPVELSAVVREMRATPGRYAVVGVPCFIKAIQLLRREDPILRERVAFTLGLFCGHMKSARFAESFAWQLRARPRDVRAVEFRKKDPARPANWYRAELTMADGQALARDWWHLADGDWGAGFFQNAACNACDDVAGETADIAFGDAWVEPYASDGRGVNVIVVRSPALDAIVRDGIAAGRLQLSPVDADFVVATQAAGFRQRREGLALRLTWPRRGVRPRKRVAPRADGLTLRRRLVYASRAHISAWSHRVFLAARLLHAPALYIGWARAAAAVYQALTYSRGPLGAWIDRLEARAGSRRS